MDVRRLGYFRGLGRAGPAQVLLEHVDQCRDLHEGRFLAKWTRRTLQISIDPLAAIDVFRVLQS